MHPEPHKPTDAPDRRRPTALVGWLIGPVFGGLALWFLSMSPAAAIPRGAPSGVTRDQIIPGALRQRLAAPPVITVGAYQYHCNECHRFFDSPPVVKRTLNQHTQIKLTHGMNDRCFNCHDRRDRERLALYDGTTIGFDQVPRLCAQCHGTVYRDWQQGTHGKTLGSWDASSGKQHRLECTDCHDPHSPAYKPLKPLPGPNTLRMGEQPPKDAEELRRHTPLRHWSSGEAAEHSKSAPGEKTDAATKPAPQESHP